MTITPIFYIKAGNLSFGDKTVLSEIEGYIYPGDRICLVGRNGSGKSSLMKVIFGDYELDSGELFKDPAIKIDYLKQDMKNIPDSTIYDYVLSSFKNPDEHKYLADIILKNLQIDGNLRLGHCSGGQVRRSLLAKALIQEPEILLLDEPTNHLDISAIEWLEDYVKGYKGCIICISHDRAFLSNTTNKVWWIDRGELRRSNRGFKYYDEWREEVINEEESILRNMNRKLESERDWLGTGVTARRKRNQKRLANLHRLREQLRTHQQKLSSAKAKIQIELIEEAKKTKFILEAENINYSYSNRDIIKNFSIKVKKGEKIGIIGPNGSGKTTLIKLLTGELLPSEGKVKHGTNLEITYFDQHRSELNPGYTIQKTLCPSGGDQIFLKNKTMHVAAYVKNFMFDPKIINDKVSTLSGGEANRLLLAKALINPGNLLILDEPTNDLDMDSLEMLQELLAEYDGTLFIVSHDRDFLEKLVTRTLVFTQDKVIDLYGGYEDYLKYYAVNQKAVVNNNKDKAERVSNKPVATDSLGASTSKLSYKYQRLSEVLPLEIETLEAKISKIENDMMAADLYTKNPERFYKLNEELSKAKASLDEKVTQWLEIEAMKE